MNKRTFIILIINFFVAFNLSLSKASNNVVYRERVFLQTDKDIYLSGETVFVKIITTDIEGIPNDLSKVACVELLGENDVKIQLQVAINNSSGSAYFIIPIDLPTATYRLVGYTQFMRNEGDEVFFEKELFIINTLQKIVLSNDSSNIQLKNRKLKKQENILISSDKTKYFIRNKGKLFLKNLPKDVLTLSVSITGNDIISNNNQIDIIDWKKKISEKSTLPFSNLFVPEYEGHIVRGILIENTKNDEQKNDKLIIPFLSFLGEEIQLFSGVLNKNNEVYYITKRVNNCDQVVTSVFSEPQNTKFRIDLISPFAEHVFKELSKITIFENWSNDLQKRSIALQSLHLFESPVKIVKDTMNAYFQWKPDVIYNLDDYTRFSTMEDVVIEIVSFIRFRKVNGKRILQISVDNIVRSEYIPIPTLILLDGVPIMDHEEIFNYDPDNIKKIEIYRDRFVFGNYYCNGIVHFISTNNDLTNFRLNQASQLLRYEMPQENIRFLAPDYSIENTARAHLPDFRHTLLWEPDVKTNGESTVEIPFWTSDYTGEFKIVVEGITKSGEVIYAEEVFNVE